MININKISILCLYILIYISSYSFAQQKDTNNSIIKQNDTIRLNTLVERCWDYRLYEPLKSFENGIEGLMLAERLGKSSKVAQLNCSAIFCQKRI